jgi:hypothetical protein
MKLIPVFVRLFLYLIFVAYLDSYIYSFMLYLFFEYFVLDLYLYLTEGLKRMSLGLDTVFFELKITSCFYAILERPMTSIGEIKE